MSCGNRIRSFVFPSPPVCDVSFARRLHERCRFRHGIPRQPDRTSRLRLNQAEIDNRSAITLDTNGRRFNHEINKFLHGPPDAWRVPDPLLISEAGPLAGRTLLVSPDRSAQPADRADQPASPFRSGRYRCPPPPSRHSERLPRFSAVVPHDEQAGVRVGRAASFPSRWRASREA